MSETGNNRPMAVSSFEIEEGKTQGFRKGFSSGAWEKLSNEEALKWLEMEEALKLEGDITVAGKRAEKMRVFGQNGEPLSLKESPLNLGLILGPGIFSYFYFIKFMSLVFGVLSIFALFLVYFNLTGEGLNANQSQLFFEKMSLGNIDNMAFELSNLLGHGEEEIAKGIEKAVGASSWKGTVMVYIDIISCVILLLGLFLYRYEVFKFKKMASRDSLSLKDFALQVKKVPANYSEKDLWDYFEKFGEIREVAIWPKENGVLKKMSSLYRDLVLREENSKTPKNLTLKIKLEAKIKTKSKELKEMAMVFWGKNLLHFDEMETEKAFVIFESKNTRDHLLKVLGKKDKQFHKVLPKMYFFPNGSLPEIEIPSPPSQILWLNLSAKNKPKKKGKHKKLKNLFNLFCPFLSILATALLIWIFFAIFGFSSPSECPLDLKLNDFSSDFGDLYGKAKETKCFCYSLPLSKYKNKALDLCHSYQFEIIFIPIVNIVSPILLVLSGIITRNLGLLLVKKRHPPTLKVLQTRTFTAFFWLSFIDSILLLFVLRFQVKGFGISEIVGLVFDWDLFGTNSDIGREWYAQTGMQITLFLLMQMLWEAFGFFIKRGWDRVWIKRKTKGNVSQKRVNELLEPPEIFVERWFANCALVLGACIIFYGAIPVLVPMVAIFLGVLYWTHKCILLRFARQPEPFERFLVPKVLFILNFCLLLHFLFSAFAYTSPEIFPEGIDTSLTDLDEQYRKYLEAIDNRAWERGTKFVVYAIFFVFLALEMVVEHLLWKLIKRAWACLFRKSFQISPSEETNHAKENTFSSWVPKMRGLKSFDFRKNPKTKDILLQVDNYLIQESSEVPKGRFKKREIISPKAPDRPSSFLFKNEGDGRKTKQLERPFSQASSRDDQIPKEKVLNDGKAINFEGVDSESQKQAFSIFDLKFGVDLGVKPKNLETFLPKNESAVENTQDKEKPFFYENPKSKKEQKSSRSFDSENKPKAESKKRKKTGENQNVGEPDLDSSQMKLMNSSVQSIHVAPNSHGFSKESILSSHKNVANGLEKRISKKRIPEQQENSSMAISEERDDHNLFQSGRNMRPIVDSKEAQDSSRLSRHSGILSNPRSQNKVEGSQLLTKANLEAYNKIKRNLEASRRSSLLKESQEVISRTGANWNFGGRKGLESREEPTYDPGSLKANGNEPRRPQSSISSGIHVRPYSQAGPGISRHNWNKTNREWILPQYKMQRIPEHLVEIHSPETFNESPLGQNNPSYVRNNNFMGSNNPEGRLGSQSRPRSPFIKF